MDTEEIKKLAPEILSEIQKASNILLHCHVNPDQDSYGSALAMQNALTQLGKNVSVIKGDNDMLTYLSPLPGYDKILEKNFFEIDISEFDLFIILDSSSPDRISRLGDVTFPETLTTICIDHHDTNTKDHVVDLVLPEAPSTTSILYHLFQNWNIDIDENIALCLLIGLYGDTSAFTNNAATPEALSIAATLTTKHPNTLKILRTIFHSNDKQMLLFWQAALDSLETSFDDRVAFAHVPHEILSKQGIKQEHIERVALADQLTLIRNWEIVVSMLEVSPGTIRVSFRTKDPEKYNAAEIAKTLGGGGHAAAAGVIMENTTLSEAREKIEATLKTTFSS